MPATGILRDMATAGPQWHSGGRCSPRHHYSQPLSLELDQIGEQSEEREDSSDGAEFADCAFDFSVGKDSSAMSGARRTSPAPSHADICEKYNQNPSKPASRMSPQSTACSFLIAMDEPPPSLHARRASISADAKRSSASRKSAHTAHPLPPSSSARGQQRDAMKAYKTQVAEALRKGLTVKM
mmetsp:Transcript_39100/g.96241  ORF Transcript_39100/g.96241 Transcript_39100/m.96241 type:complete len:183 (+) Transcript_39100:389-937(+)